MQVLKRKKKHKIYKNKRVISFSIFLKTYFDSSSKTRATSFAKVWQKAWNTSTLLVIFVDLKILFVISLPKHRKRFLTQWQRIITLGVHWVVNSFFCDYMAIKYYFFQILCSSALCFWLFPVFPPKFFFLWKLPNELYSFINV